jgi:NAD(P)-dependent dehydrogenase (short-subunit alcohol dehydrogenase family)
MTLEGKTALVTGGTRGIGLAIGRALDEAGANVVAVGRSQERVDELRAALGDGSRITGRVCDVRDRPALERLRESLDSLDILVPNAGVTTRREAVDLDDAALRDMIETNLYGVFVTCQVMAPLLLRKPGGRCVVTSSVSAIHGQRLRVAYAATKAGLGGLVRALAVEWGPLGCTVNAVGPGVVRTPMVEEYIAAHPERLEAVIAHTPLRRVAEPEDVAGVVTFLASEAAGFISGQTIFVDGGLTAGSDWW